MVWDLWLMLCLPSPSKLKDLPLWVWQLPKILFDAFQTTTSKQSSLSTTLGSSVIVLSKPKKKVRPFHSHLTLNWFAVVICNLNYPKFCKIRVFCDSSFKAFFHNDSRIESIFTIRCFVPITMKNMLTMHSTFRQSY